jgi:para-aminobenzoate synthetase/4-amino-4-deoxychorismate lyase
LVETVLIRDGHPVALADHLARLDRSCRELYGQPPQSDLAGMVGRIAAAHRRGRLRIVARPVGDRLDVRVTVAPLTGPTGVHRLAAVARHGGSWRHKYADRRWLAAAEERVGPGRLPLFVGAAGTVLETSRGNVFLVESGRLVTPPATDSILPGVTRRMVLDIAFDLNIPVRIEPISMSRMHAAAGLFSTSAISEVIHIEEVDGVALPAAGPLECAVTEATRVYE